MVQDVVIDKVALAIRSARDGIEYDAKNGAICPYCGKRARVTHKVWFDRSCKRYHKCKNPKCLFCITDETIISWQDV